jgi:hypothetical protein
MNAATVLMVLALICFVMEAFGAKPAWKINFVALGLALWVLALLWPLTIRAG